jgi:hypothetical protein
MSGQWIPNPVAETFQLFRCSAVAWNSRENHTKGTVIVLPSARSTHNGLPLSCGRTPNAADRQLQRARPPPHVPSIDEDLVIVVRVRRR